QDGAARARRGAGPARAARRGLRVVRPPRGRQTPTPPPGARPGDAPATRPARLPGGGWAIPERCDAVLSILSPPGTTLNGVRESIEAFLRMLEQEEGEVRFEFKLVPIGAGRLWLRP